MQNKSQPLRVLAFGEVYSRNVGDGIIFECLRRSLAQRGVEVRPADMSLRDGFEEVAAERLSSGRVSPMRRFARYFVRRSLLLRRMITAATWYARGRAKFISKYQECVRESDGLIIGGGQILVDRQLYFPLAISAILSMAKKESKAVVVYACGADARSGLIARCIFKSMAKQAAYISVRDDVSAKFINDLKAPSVASVCADVGYLTGSVYPHEVPPFSKILGVNVMPQETVAVHSSVVRSASRESYLKFWRTLVQKALEQGWQVRIMTNGDAVDAVAAKEIYSHFIDEARVSLCAPPLTPAALVDMMRGVDSLIASRMHAGIVAYSLGKKVAPLVWDIKVTGVWREADDAVELFSFNDLFKYEDMLDKLLGVVLNDGLNGTVNSIHSLVSKIELSVDGVAEIFSRERMQPVNGLNHA